jgi:hypothetical protein
LRVWCEIGSYCEDCGPGPFLSLSLLSSHHEGSSFAPPYAPCMKFCLATGPEAKEPSDHCQLCAKINTSSFYVFVSGILSQWQQAD